MNDDGDTDHTFISFHNYDSVICCYFHIKLVPDNGKTFSFCINLGNFDKGKVTTQKSLILKSCIILDFCSD